MRILITGGMGFVGSSLAKGLVGDPDVSDIVVLDNLVRRGSELNIPELSHLGVKFVHGDVRDHKDLSLLEGSFDVLVEASAEPSVHAGVDGSPRYLLDTNLGGAINCLEFARERCGGMIFLSSSRVYSIDALCSIPLQENGDRLALVEQGEAPGVSAQGIAEGFTTDGPRSYYGASKLAAEHLCQEYARFTNLDVVINRSGVIAGPGQFGKTDQGVFTLWVARHHFGGPLSYTGFGGKGLQVRDLLHPQDLLALVKRQIEQLSNLSGKTFNIGGGVHGAVSLREYTSICREVTGRELDIGAVADTAAVDVPWYISDCSRICDELDWQPEKTPDDIARDIHDWIRANEKSLTKIFA